MAEPQWSLQATVLGLAMASRRARSRGRRGVVRSSARGYPCTAAHVATVVVAAACLAIRPKASETAPAVAPQYSSRRLAVLLVVVLVVGVGGIDVWWLAPLVAGEPLNAGVLRA